MKYQIGNKNFKTKTTITDYFSFILKTNKESTKLTGQQLEDVINLLNFHTEKDDKIGCGIDYITTERHVDVINRFKSKTQHFHIYRTDGTDVDFSYKNCVNNIGKNGYVSKKRDDVLKALRFDVRPQIDEFRTNIFGNKTYLKCEVLGVNFSKKTCHIDHIPPKTFTNIVSNFLEFYNLKIEDIEIEPVDAIYDTLKNKEVKDNWISYHMKHAELRAIHKTANLAQKKSHSVDLNK